MIIRCALPDDIPAVAALERETFSLGAEEAALERMRQNPNSVILCAAEDGTLAASSGWTDIFIYPGYRFKIMDALITNFHLPESTLLMLVSAFAGREHILAAYETAVARRFRFFSFGDAMFIE